MSCLVIPHSYLRQALRGLRQRPEAPVWSLLGKCAATSGHHWLAGPVKSSLGVQPGSGNGSAVAKWLRLRIATGPQPQAREPVLPGPAQAHAEPALELILGTGERRGHLWLRHSGLAVTPVEAVMLVGPGMHRIAVAAAVTSSTAEAQAAQVPPHSLAPLPAQSQQARPSVPGEDSDSNRSVFQPGVPDNITGRLGVRTFKRLSAIASSHSPSVRWSRTIAALGGDAVWRRLCQLRIALIGCGRSGSVLADMLAGTGIQCLVLIDPDILEEHNLGEMAGVQPAQVGLPKAEALARHLRAHGSSELDLTCVAEPLWSPAALRTAKECDALIVAADHDSARLTAGILSTLYHKLLLDAATGIHDPAPAQAPASSAAGPTPRVMGADVRLLVPGDGCLLCRGGLSAHMDAVDTLCRQPMQPLALSDWRRQRAGSLRSLNTTAAALALRLLEDLVAERLTGSAWAHVEFDPAGGLSVTHPAHAPSAPCVLCAKAGLGDAGLSWG